ncbi:MAG: hypothetical protein KZQ71_10720 [Candidatus Thiodiazotropha sp. (ex Lucinoma aequizonata)]|nr:hypothetical protein [Candidatus Thiodiazotropha sp. (ex Lucinoma aequizonata)]
MSETTTERLCKAFHQNLVALGYPESGIVHYEQQRLNGDWNQVFKISDPERGLLLAVVGLHTACASIQSYAVNLSYTEDGQCILLSRSPNAGVQGFLFSPAGEGLVFHQVNYTDHGTCLVIEIDEFPSFEKLKRQHKLKKLSQHVASCSGKAIYRKDKGDDQKYYQRFNKKRG